MKTKITLLEMAKLTNGQSLQEDHSTRYAIECDDKIWVKHLNAYQPVLFEKDLIHELSLLLLKNTITHDERTCLHYLAHKLNIEDQLYEKMFGE